MSDDTLPTVSAVIPARNAAGHIGDAMRSVLAQDYPAELELIVATGTEDDGTRQEAMRVADGDRRVRVIENQSGRTPVGLNAAIALAKGQVIVRCDAQAVLPPDYLATAVRVLVDTGADVVGGVQAARGHTFMERAVAIAMTTPIGTGGPRFRVGGRPGPTDTVYLGVFRRAALERVGLYDEAMTRNQDYELNHRVRASGGVVYFHPDLAVAYTPRATLLSLWRQYFAYGEWKRRLLRRHPEALRARQLVPPLFVIALIASAVTALTPWRLAALVVPALYAASLAATVLLELVRRRDPAALAMPLAAVTMHVAWGIGFLGADGAAPEPQIPPLPAR